MKVNKSSAIGLIGAAGVLYFGVLRHAANPAIFLDPHAIMLVIGGTLAAAFIAYPFQQLISIIDLVNMAIFYPKRFNRVDICQELLVAANLWRTQPVRFQTLNSSHPFLQEGYKLISGNALTDDELHDVLRKRSLVYKKNYQADCKALNAIAKFPPAFGLLGASTGMIEMMSNLDKDGTGGIGSAMAVALVATFWGIALANLVILPLSDHANKISNEDSALRDLMIDGIILVKSKQRERVVIEGLRSYLPPSQRKLLRPLEPESETAEVANDTRLVG